MGDTLSGETNADKPVVPSVVRHPPAPVAPGSDTHNTLVITAPTWIEIVLEDEEGAPVDHVRCRFTPGTADPMMAVLNDAGFLHVEGLYRKSASVTFPDIDQEDWDHAGTSPPVASSQDAPSEKLACSRFQPHTLPAEHVAAERETLRTIADQYGFQDWKRIYLDEKNADFRTLRKHPGAIQPGDRLIIPAKREKQVSVAYKQTHRFRLKPRTEILSLILKDDYCVPYAQKRYELTVDGQSYRGETDENGGLSHEVPLHAKKGTLKAWIEDDPKAEPVTWNLNIGKVLPVEDVRGLQMRLNRLGFDAGPVTGQMNAKTRSAILALQTFLAFESPDGDPTQETLQGVLDLEEALYENEEESPALESAAQETDAKTGE